MTYAKQDADAEDDVAGPGNGFVDVYDTGGNAAAALRQRAGRSTRRGASRRRRRASAAASGALLIGNFGDGRINAYDPVSGKFLGALRERARPAARRSTGCGR